MSDTWKKIMVTSIYGYKTRAPMINIDISAFPKDHPLQLHVEEARDLAHNILAAAEAAEQDGFIFSFFKDQLGTTEKEAAAALLAYREHRDKERGLQG